MKKISLGVLAMLFAASSLMAITKVPVKKAKAKHAACTSCPKGQKCTKATCDDPQDCCK
jgi:hypothetical protein